MTAPDVAVVTRRLDTLIRAATKIRAHIADLHTLAWEPATNPDVDRVAGGASDHTPRTGNPRARRLFDQIAVNVAQIEAELVGFERTMTGLFVAGQPNAEPSRGSLISAAEHQRLLDRQQAHARAGGYVPQRLQDQPSHPGKHR